MKHNIKKTLSEIADRWKSESPKIFQSITTICCAISATALAMHIAVESGGGVEPQWWTEVYPYIIGIPAGMAAVAKLTKKNNNQDNGNI